MLFVSADLDQQSEQVLKFLESVHPQIEQKIEEALDQAQAAILNRLRRTFLNETDPDGIAWEPSYAAFRRSFMGRGGGTLFDTGRLFHSIQLAASSKGERVIGTDVPYAPYHQNGVGNLPKRVFLSVSEEHINLARRIFTMRLNEALNP